jgi:D-inositol-3-phosphate glycosyltransferase
VRRVNDLFTWRKVALGIAQLYEDVLGRTSVQTGSETGQLMLLERSFEDAIDTLRVTRESLVAAVADVASMLVACYQRGGKVLIAGNGGSAADAQHFATELVGRFKVKGRRGLPTIALTADGVLLTAWSNDIGYEDVFARQVEALGNAGDILIGISTSGNSPNLTRAFRVAAQRDVQCVAFLGRDGGELLPLADRALVVPSGDTQRIQETQILLIHLICELVDEAMSDAPVVRAAGSIWEDAVQTAVAARRLTQVAENIERAS